MKEIDIYEKAFGQLSLDELYVAYLRQEIAENAVVLTKVDNFHISEAAGVYESSFSEGSSILLAGDMADTGQTSIQRWQPTQLFPTM